MENRVRQLLLSLTLAAISSVASAQDAHPQVVGTSGSGITREALERSNTLDQCMKVFESPPMCRCLSEAIPSGITFEQYFVILTRPKSENGYEKLSRTGKAVFDSLPKIRDTCATRSTGSAP